MFVVATFFLFSFFEKYVGGDTMKRLNVLTSFGQEIMLLLCFVVASLAQFPGATDLVTSLPGVTTMPPFNIYAGYLSVSSQNASNAKHFFYTFVEAANSSSAAPLVRWFNGGPGCSSVGGGMFQELGPLIPDGNGGLQSNPYSWNRRANMLFVESPVGVGFSFSKNDADYTSSDASTAVRVFVLFFFFDLMY
jgi:carboxypeptidase C (cathepsin A)